MTTSTKNLTFFYAPQTRATGVLNLLEELGADYDLHVLNLKAGEQRQPDFLKINPMGKVPALRYHGEVITEQVACYIFLADLYAEKKLAPALTDKLRGPYLRWMAFYGSSFEPAIVDKSRKVEVGFKGMSPYGDYDTTIKTITDQLKQKPYFLGETFSAADVLWATALKWTTSFELVAKTPEISSYCERVFARPAFIRAHAKEREILATFQK